MSKWRPMETAPKDGTHFLAWILGFDECDYPVLVRWHIQQEDWIIADFIAAEFAGDDIGLSHWMPLPKPPKETEDENE